jgi:hypothetical protein
MDLKTLNTLDSASIIKREANSSKRRRSKKKKDTKIRKKQGIFGS